VPVHQTSRSDVKKYIEHREPHTLTFPVTIPHRFTRCASLGCRRRSTGAAFRCFFGGHAGYDGVGSKKMVEVRGRLRKRGAGSRQTQKKFGRGKV
jgi:hypothetical protein